MSRDGGKGCHCCRGVRWGRRELLKVNSTVCILISWSYTYQNQEAPRSRELLEKMLRVLQGCRLCSGPSAPGVCSSILSCGFAAAQLLPCSLAVAVEKRERCKNNRSAAHPEAQPGPESVLVRNRSLKPRECVYPPTLNLLCHTVCPPYQRAHVPKRRGKRPVLS